MLTGPAGWYPCTAPTQARTPTHGRANWEKARNEVNSSKVSQNAEVSPKSVHKACHSPCFSKRASKVSSWNSEIYVLPSLLSQGINGPVLGLPDTLWSK